MKFCQNPKCPYHVDAPAGTRRLEVRVPGKGPTSIEETIVMTNLPVINPGNKKCFHFCEVCVNVFTVVNS